MSTNLIARELAPITEAEVQELAKVWYDKLDVHAPLEEYIPLLAETGLKMVFPETTVEGFAGFKGWYDRVINLFFDEVHTLKSVMTIPEGDRVQVKAIVKWEASRWQPPTARSERIVLDAYQTWEVERSPVTGKPVILAYTVDALDYYEGSARL